MKKSIPTRGLVEAANELLQKPQRPETREELQRILWHLSQRRARKDWNERRRGR